MIPALLLGLTPLAAAAPVYRPLLDPVPLGGTWLWMILPLSAAIAVVYKTLKLRDLRRLPREAAAMTAQIVLFMTLAAAALWVLTEMI